MIEFKLFGIRVCFDFSFFAVAAVFMLFFGGGFWREALVACAVHELSHLLVMNFCGAAADRITFYGAGIRITSGRVEGCSFSRRLAVYAAGCAANFALFAAMLALGFESGAAVNLLVGIFNLLPFGELDGGAIIRMLLIRFAQPARVDTLLHIAEISAVTVLTVGVTLVCGGINAAAVALPLYFFTVSRLSAVKD